MDFTIAEPLFRGYIFFSGKKVELYILGRLALAATKLATKSITCHSPIAGNKTLHECFTRKINNIVSISQYVNKVNPPEVHHKWLCSLCR
jgi:hypothetical protein